FFSVGPVALTTNFTITDTVPEVVTVTLVDNFPINFVMPTPSTVTFTVGTWTVVAFSPTPAAGGAVPGLATTITLVAQDSAGHILTSASSFSPVTVTVNSTSVTLSSSSVLITNGYGYLTVTGTTVGIFQLGIS